MMLDGLCIHTGPIIRREESYVNMEIHERRRIFNKLVAFIRQVDIRYKCFYIEKKHIEDVIEASGKLSKQISLFIREHYDEFRSFDQIKIYYDKRYLSRIPSPFQRIEPQIPWLRFFIIGNPKD